jgi:hypothetical protein
MSTPSDRAAPAPTRSPLADLDRADGPAPETEPEAATGLRRLLFTPGCAVASTAPAAAEDARRGDHRDAVPLDRLAKHLPRTDGITGGPKGLAKVHRDGVRPPPVRSSLTER